MEKIPQELKDLLIKIIIPSLVAMSIKLALQSRKEKLSLFNSVASVIIGLGCAYLSSNWVLHNFEDTALPIACITIIGEKVAYWMIFKLSIDELGDAFIQHLVDKYKNK